MFVDTCFLKVGQTRLYLFCSMSKSDLRKSNYTHELLHIYFVNALQVISSVVESIKILF